ncbi:ganglioside GM2 activator-like [Stegostoma tigrinum]|uniref:ganglioside GM2 activator-like n=1 Tax=Stegostoma tigrinum TaxID=3053191 RepID=UPI00202ACDD2|nr:ganglioside GM2 activator-like [Stegostoma tigrinum]
MAVCSGVILLAVCLLFQIRTSNGFSWKDCSRASDPIKFKQISFEPDPLKLPGYASYEGTAYVSQSVSSITAEVTLYKKFLFWWKIPCFDAFPCNFDICELFGRDSSCSFSSGYFKSPKQSYYISRPRISSFLLKGYYSATIILKSHGKQVGCTYVYFNIDG